MPVVLLKIYCNEFIYFPVRACSHRWRSNLGSLPKKAISLGKSAQNPSLFRLRSASSKETSYRGVTDCSHGTIAAAIYFSQLMGCMEFSLAVAIAPCEH